MKKKKSERKRERSSAPLGTIKLGGLSPRSHLNVRSKEAAYLWPRDKIARAILITHRRDSRRIVKRGDVETVRLSTNSPAINDRATEYKLRPREKSLSTMVLDVNDHFETPKRKMKKKRINRQRKVKRKKKERKERDFWWQAVVKQAKPRLETFFRLVTTIIARLLLWNGNSSRFTSQREHPEIPFSWMIDSIASACRPCRTFLSSWRTLLTPLLFSGLRSVFFVPWRAGINAI